MVTDRKLEGKGAESALKLQRGSMVRLDKGLSATDHYWSRYLPPRKASMPEIIERKWGGKWKREVTIRRVIAPCLWPIIDWSAGLAVPTGLMLCVRERGSAESRDRVRMNTTADSWARASKREFCLYVLEKRMRWPADRELIQSQFWACWSGKHQHPPFEFIDMEKECSHYIFQTTRV